jgi:hypothetical protein
VTAGGAKELLLGRLSLTAPAPWAAAWDRFGPLARPQKRSPDCRGCAPTALGQRHTYNSPWPAPLSTTLLVTAAHRGARETRFFACGSLVCWNARADSRLQRACWAIGVSTRTHRHVCVKGRDGRSGEACMSAHAAWDPMQHASPCRGTTQPCSVVHAALCAALDEEKRAGAK